MKKYICISATLLVMIIPLSMSLKGIHSKMKEDNMSGAFVDEDMEQRRMSSPAISQQPIVVSMIQLIANPTAYSGKSVRIIGFVRIELEGTAVYMHQEDYKVAISKNALWLAIDRANRQSYMNGDQKYVLIEGTFDAENKGHRGAFSGTVKDISRFQIWAG